VIDNHVEISLLTTILTGKGKIHNCILKIFNIHIQTSDSPPHREVFKWLPIPKHIEEKLHHDYQATIEENGPTSEPS